MPTSKLTQGVVDRFQPGAKSRTEWDTLTRGFGVRVSPAGKKSWIAMYRVGTKQVFETISNTGKVPKLEDARKLAQQSMLKALAGVNPVEVRRTQQKAVEADILTLGRLCDRFLTDYASGRYRASSLAEVKRLLGRTRALADKPAGSIKRTDVLCMLEGIAAKRLKRMPGKGDRPIAETRNIQNALNTMFRWALSEELIEVNPMVTIRKDRFGTAVARDRVLDDGEIVKFWRAMERIGWPFGPIGKLLLLTGQRRGEVGGMTWSELDLDRCLWTIPRERAKNDKLHLVHLSPLAMSIIRGLPHIKTDGDWVFPNDGGTKHVGEYDRGKKAADALMPGIPPWVWHDLRRTATTIMAKCGIAPHVADRVLNHQSGTISGVAAVYNRFSYIEERKEALEKLGQYIESLVTPA